MKELIYYGGDGFGGLPDEGDFSVKYQPHNMEEMQKEFIKFDQAKRFYDKLQCPKAFWCGIELIDAYTYE